VSTALVTRIFRVVGEVPSGFRTNLKPSTEPIRGRRQSGRVLCCSADTKRKVFERVGGALSPAGRFCVVIRYEPCPCRGAVWRCADRPSWSPIAEGDEYPSRRLKPNKAGCGAKRRKNSPPSDGSITVMPKLIRGSLPIEAGDANTSRRLCRDSAPRRALAMRAARRGRRVSRGSNAASGARFCDLRRPGRSGIRAAAYL
jgi:hypothetical protein